MTPLFVLAFIAASIGGCMAQQRVTGRVDAREGEIPYIVSLRDDTGKHQCSGSILDDRWIATAASCFTGEMPAYVIAGTVKLNASYGTQYKIDKKIDHPQYDAEKKTHDFALMKTECAIAFDDYVQPIPLGLKNLDSNSSVKVTGWFVNELGQRARLLKLYNTYTMSDEDCATELPDTEMSHHLMCVANLPGSGPCQGDIGAPLVSKGRLHGITSWSSSPCGEGKPDGASKVATFVPWIFWTKMTNIF